MLGKVVDWLLGVEGTVQPRTSELLEDIETSDMVELAPVSSTAIKKVSAPLGKKVKRKSAKKKTSSIRIHLRHWLINNINFIYLHHHNRVTT